MKNQYAGDQNDYVKFGLLRALCGTELRPFVAWMLTPDDTRTDGRRRDYLNDPRWQDHDPSLHEALNGIGASGQPDVATLERTVPLPGASFFREIVPDFVTERRQWSQDLASQGHDLVFFDPDNGFEIKSKPIGRIGSSKFVAWAEVEATVKNGQSALVYQHYPRVPRPQFAADLLEQIARRTGCETAVAFHTAHVLFLLAVAPRHRQALERGIARVEEKWDEHERISIQRLEQPLCERHAPEGAIMSLPRERVEALALDLPASDRAHLALRLLESLEDGVDDPADGERAWVEEIRHRLDDYKAGLV